MSSRGIEDKLRAAGYIDAEIDIYNRLGPKARAVIYNAPRKIALREALYQFHLQRKILDPIEVDGEFYSNPLPTVYQTGDGDDEFALWLVSNRALATYHERRVDLGPDRKVKASPAWGRNIDL